MQDKKIIAMWSGPRNVSTALMRSFENRGDTIISDEPFYGYFLTKKNVRHPNREIIVNKMETDKIKISKYLSSKNNMEAKHLWYQKQMTHHIMPNDNLEWIKNIHNCFLIRNPLDVIISYKKIYSNISMDLIGFEQQNKIFDFVINNLDKNPIVIDAIDLVSNPKKILQQVCKRLKINFTTKMLSWPKGPRASDGLWGEYWYKNVWKTTSFIKKDNSKKIKKIDSELLDLHDEAQSYYQKLKKFKVK